MKAVAPPVDPLENWNDLRVQLVWAYSGPPGFAHCAVPTSFNSAWLIRQGRVDFVFKGKRTSYRAGHWVFPGVEEGYWQDFSDDARILSVRFLAQWPTGERLFAHPRPLALRDTLAPRLARLGARLAQFVSRTFPGTVLDLVRASSPTPKKYFEMQRLLFGWVLEYSNTMERLGLRPNTISRLDDRVRTAVHLMENRPLSSPLQERDLVQAVGISMAQLHRLFQKNLGTTPAEYWEARRIHAARLSILESGRSMKSIAYELGFGSLSHFS
ncbi:MAG TPA: AraC family transcriptional regulator, partial [Candidatus Methylacidiphilales bacterium]